MADGEEDRSAARLVERLRAGLQPRPPRDHHHPAVVDHPTLRRASRLVAAIPGASPATASLRRALAWASAAPDPTERGTRSRQELAARLERLERLDEAHAAGLEELRRQVDQLRHCVEAIAGSGPDGPAQP